MTFAFDPVPAQSARSSRPVDGPAPEDPGRLRLSDRERRIVLTTVEAAFPAGGRLEGGGPRTVARFERWLGEVPRGTARGLLSAYLTLEASTVPTRGRPFSRLPLEARTEALASWEKSRFFAVRALLRALLTPLKHAHFDRPEMFAHVGCVYELPTVRAESPRWLAQVTDGRQVREDLSLECEVVVIGTGAGGAAAAHELASRGRAVLLLEEGDYHRRGSFRGSASWANHAMYRDHGMTVALGNVGIPVFSGRAVGGSTVVNSGTCYRAPAATFARWRSRFGLGADFSPEGLAPYYERAETMLQVAPADRAHLGAIGPIIARGADRLGLRHGVLPRNAPACDGQGVCCFGCPTGAKRSTDVSYVPAALERGAQLVTAARVDTIDLVAGRARGVTATLGSGEGAGRPRLTVRAEAVVVAGGALMTPLLLGKSGLGKRGSLGKNLSIHPASKVFALFDEAIEQWKGIPQGYSVDHYADEGLMFEGASVPFSIASMAVPWTGRRYMDLMEQYPHLATFGFMIQDESRGEVRPGIGGAPLVLYNLNERDLRLFKRGIEILCEIFQVAGARRVLPLLPGHDEVTTAADLARLKQSRIRPGDLEVTAYHPLGTCRIGADEAACLGPDHQLAGAPGVYVCDGSAVPSSLGVNPQMTIMAMALRAAEILDSRLG
jgi:choline dehydrogenase-like flavoprotein